MLVCSAGAAATSTWSTCPAGALAASSGASWSSSSAAAWPLAAPAAAAHPAAAELASSSLQPGVPTAARPGVGPGALGPDPNSGSAALQARHAASRLGARASSAGQTRGFASVQPEHTVYSGPQTAPARRVTLRTLRAKHARGEPLTMVTAYDYPSAVHVPPRPAFVYRCSGIAR